MLSTHPSDNGGGGNSPNNYAIIDPGADQLAIIKITSGKFRGVQFRFGKVAINEVDGEPRLSFVTDILKKPLRLMFVNLKENDLFTEVSGDILVDLMQRNAQEYNKFLVG